MQQEYIITGYTIPQLSESILWRYNQQSKSYTSLIVVGSALQINKGVFTCTAVKEVSATVIISQESNHIVARCSCHQVSGQLCEHQFHILSYILRNEEVKLFFDAEMRHERIKRVAVQYGLENEADLDHYFTIRYLDGKADILPIESSLLPVTPQTLQQMNAWLFAEDEKAAKVEREIAEGTIRCIVFRQHKYYKHLLIDLYTAAVSKEGKLKNPLVPVSPLTLIGEQEDTAVIRFLTAISYFQQMVEVKRSATYLNYLKVIARNPLSYPFYQHRPEISEKVTAASLSPMLLSIVNEDICLTVNLKGQFYEIKGTLLIENALFALKDLDVRFTYFVGANQTLYLPKDLQTLGIIQLFKDKDTLLIHHSQYSGFKAKILSPLEERIKINYAYIKQATPVQLKEQDFDQGTERIIYLSDFGQYIMIVPVLRYGEVEISIRTQKQIHAADEKGKEFSVRRDNDAEQKFMSLLIKQHSGFEEQLDDDLQYFYLHRKRFLDANWFLNAFDEWHKQGVTILGFNELSDNKLNQHKVKVAIQVISGIDWFNTKAKVYFGKRRASLKHLHKAIRNKNKFVALDDGTLGILPEEWIAKFTAYFEAGEVLDDDTIITPKISYATVSQLYEREMLSAEVQSEIKTYQQRLNNFELIEDVPVPEGLFANLRTYQRQGLNWLNFLDNFNFGGCLADDMGLGKTLQIIAFILLQRKKANQNTNLLVVPTSLLFNWQAEIRKFAPSIKVFNVYGSERVKSSVDFDQFEVVLTTYGTLLSDINYLKAYHFNYIFLDESQNIKNPESSRYKAARLLKSRNKIAITGTPIENNTFDLFSQLSFACPGLLGSKQYFKDIYSSPIDKFKVSKRAFELHNRIKPFLLRRTKQEVANELPDKTEMILYCEMQAEQRKIYEAYEKEFREFVSATTNEELPKSSMHVLKGLTRLRQVCNSPLLLGEHKLPGESSAKLSVLMDEIEQRSPQHKLLVFSQFVGMLELVKKELVGRKIKFAYLTGSTRNREAEVNSFQSDPDTRVFLVSLKAGGAGLNLTAAEYVYLIDPWWNPAVENQAIDRCYRIGQHKNVVAVRLICPNTIEDKVQQLQASKNELVNSLLGHDNSVLNTLSKADLLDMLNNSLHK